MIARKILLAVLLFVPSAVMAHGVWLDGSGTEYKMIYGDAGKSEGYDGKKVVSVQGLDARRAKIKHAAAHKKGVTSLNFTTPPYAVSAEFDNGYWVEVGGEWMNRSKRTVKNYTGSDHAIKFAKRLERWAEWMKEPEGAPLEIVPLKDPFALKPGDKLPIRVIYNGAPAQDVTIERDFDGSKTYSTNKKGVAYIPMDGDGLKYLEASLTRPIQGDPDADNIYYTATLTFETGHLK